MLSSVAQMLGVVEEQARPLLDLLADRAAGCRMLLLLDNAEHLLPGIANELSALVTACPGVQLLVTSRERLQLGAEVSVPVPPLSRQDGERSFVDRARSVGVVLRRAGAACASRRLGRAAATPRPVVPRSGTRSSRHPRTS